MNSKQRIKTILEHCKPDRPGLGFFAIDSDIAGKVLGRKTYWRNKASSQLGFWQGRRDEVVQRWKEDGIELYKKLDIIDIVHLSQVERAKALDEFYIRKGQSGVLYGTDLSSQNGPMISPALSSEIFYAFNT